MWSNKEHINSLINCLLFLVAINFLHLGQLLLPIICLILFIDNKAKLKVNNLIVFIILCLFGISFFIFSYKLGFYSTMGLCLPMAYYIGSNIKKTDEDSIKKIIYIIGFGMACHVALNFVADFMIGGTSAIGSIKHYDIWTGDFVITTSTATNCIMIVSLIYYLLVYENNKTNKILGIVLFLIVFIYDIALGRRTPLFMIAICLLISLIIDKFIYKNDSNKKQLIIMSSIICGLILLVILIYVSNLFNLKNIIDNFGIVKKFKEYGLSSGRLDIFVQAIKLMPEHLWGGMQIHNILGIQVHDLWMDTFDYAGIIPYLLLVAHTILFIITFIRIIKREQLSRDFKLLIIVLFISIAIQMFLEPVMTGSSIFIILVIIIEAVLEGKLYDNKEK